MTPILEFKHKLIFYKPGILRYAMRQAGSQLGAAQSAAERREVLSHSLKRGWAEAGPSWPLLSDYGPLHRKA